MIESENAKHCIIALLSGRVSLCHQSQCDITRRQRPIRALVSFTLGSNLLMYKHRMHLLSGCRQYLAYELCEAVERDLLVVYLVIDICEKTTA